MFVLINARFPMTALVLLAVLYAGMTAFAFYWRGHAA
jgi:hypothetical protein